MTGLDRNLVFGIHAVSSVLSHGASVATLLWVDRARRGRRFTELVELARKNNVPVTRVSATELNELADGGRHGGVIAACARGPGDTEVSLESVLSGVGTHTLLLVLDGVQDPHNLGACLRCADGAGVDAVIVPRDRACPITPTVRQVASGAADAVPMVRVTNLARTMETLKQRGIWLIGASDDAPADVFQSDLSGPSALVFGAEGRGLRRLTRDNCDLLVRIPMAGEVPSLNVSVAVGICLYEVRRQQVRRSRDNNGLKP